MKYEIEGDLVVRIDEIVTPRQTAVIKAFHDMVYHTKVTADKAAISANGVEYATVTARIFNWENNFRVGDDREVSFEVDGVPVGTVQAVNGIATIQVRTSTPGYLAVRTSNQEMRNGDVVISAVQG